jgi:hypothetical protein
METTHEQQHNSDLTLQPTLCSRPSRRADIRYGRRLSTTTASHRSSSTFSSSSSSSSSPQQQQQQGRCQRSEASSGYGTGHAGRGTLTDVGAWRNAVQLLQHRTLRVRRDGLESWTSLHDRCSARRQRARSLTLQHGRCVPACMKLAAG